MERPKLEKPGAGLPFVQRMFLRLYIRPFLSRKANKEQNLRMFKMVSARIVKEYESVPAGKRDQKVLVPPMRGVEDSSRYWSPNELIEHLLITGVGMRDLVVSLASGKTMDWEVRIEDFKPKGKFQGGDPRKDFQAFIEETVKILEPLPIEDGGLTHKHPWMGQFNSLQWTWLLSGHSGIHLAQLQAIKKGL